MTGNDMWTFWHIYRKTDNLELRALVALSNLLAQHFGVPPRDVLRTLSQALDGERLDTYAFNYVFFFIALATVSSHLSITVRIILFRSLLLLVTQQNRALLFNI